MKSLFYLVERFLLLKWHSLVNHLYDVRVISGVEVFSYWRLTYVVIRPGYILIPLNKRKEDLKIQIDCINKYLRKSIELRIKNKI